MNSCWSDSQHCLSTHRVKSNTMIAAILQTPHNIWTEGRRGRESISRTMQYNMTMVLTHICNRLLSCYQIFHVLQCPYIVDSNMTVITSDQSCLLLFKHLYLLHVLFPRKLAKFTSKFSLESSSVSHKSHYRLPLTKAEDWSWHLSIPEFSVKNQHR